MVDVSIIIPVYNGAQWLPETLLSIISQTFIGKLEVSIYNDASTDSTLEIITSFRHHLECSGISLVVSSNSDHKPRGVGWARNQAIKQSSAPFLCLHDADDVMFPDRVNIQYIEAKKNPNALIGGCYIREPLESTERYTRWCNTITTTQLYTQAYTSFGPTIIIPTWFMTRELFDKYGPFDERGKGIPEDLLFYYKILHDGIQLLRVDRPVITYRYHSYNTTHSIKEETIWDLRVTALQDHVIVRWSHFTIWNAGKQGRRLYRSLRQENQCKVQAFCDVDQKKLSKQVYTYEDSLDIPKPVIPIVHFREAKPPFIICVKWDLTGGEFERNLTSLHLKEGEDYYNFS